MKPISFFVAILLVCLVSTARAQAGPCCEASLEPTKLDKDYEGLGTDFGLAKKKLRANLETNFCAKKSNPHCDGIKCPKETTCTGYAEFSGVPDLETKFSCRIVGSPEIPCRDLPDGPCSCVASGYVKCRCRCE